MNWAIQNFDQVWPLGVEHIYLSVIPTLVGLITAVPIGMLVHRIWGLRRAVVVLSSIIFTIPSLALFVVIPAVVGTRILDPLNVIIALSLYSVALLVRTVLESLDAVPDEVRSAAEAIGTSELRRSITIDLPLSIPVLTAGTRVVAVTNVSLVTVGAVIGVGGLGQLFTSGYQRDYPDQIFAGILATLVLAFVFDRLLAWIGRLLTPWTRASTATGKVSTEKTGTGKVGTEEISTEETGTGKAGTERNLARSRPMRAGRSNTEVSTTEVSNSEISTTEVSNSETAGSSAAQERGAR